MSFQFDKLACADDLILVTGPGGFIGGHLVAELRPLGCRQIRAVGVKPLEYWYQRFAEFENVSSDLKNPVVCEDACDGAATCSILPPTWVA
jgi:GDP-D-mannose 3', 5'-epimerase